MLRKNFVDSFLSTLPKLSLLTGPAGSGKSTIIKTLVSRLEDVTVLTPTNAACKRLKDDGVPSSTIASYLNARPETNMLASSHEESERIVYGEAKGASIVIIDEYSMASAYEIEAILESCDTLLLCGDAAQLPPVKGKAFDTRDVDLAYELTTIWRTPCPLLTSRINKIRMSGLVTPDCSGKELVEAFLADECDDKIFLAKENSHIQEVAAMLPETKVFLGYRSYTFWRKDDEDLRLMNGDTITPIIVDGSYKDYMPTNTSAHTKFSEHPLCSDDRYFTCNCEEIEEEHFIHCWRGTEVQFNKEVLAPAFDEFRVNVKVLVNQTGLSEEELWKHKPKILTTMYAQWKMIKNTFVVEDARVSTIHKSQGRGFSHVYLLDNKLSSKELYVGCSRTRKFLCVGKIK